MEHTLPTHSLARGRSDAEALAQNRKALLATACVVVATVAGAITAWIALPVAAVGNGSFATTPTPAAKLSGRGMATIPCAARWKFETDHWVCVRGPK